MEDARADTLHNAMNHAPFAGGVAAFEYDYDLRAVRPYPFLHFD
jgi:hypothetical protein